MQRKQFIIAGLFVLLTLSLAGAQTVLDVFISDDDIELDWTPANSCRIDYTLIIPPDYQTLVANAGPPYYHEDVLHDGIDYFYSVYCGPDDDSEALEDVADE
ncbi:hypothetical protein JXQ70_17925 [bacterium]|nr:hypothetical protein [bacterium]